MSDEGVVTIERFASLATGRGGMPAVDEWLNVGALLVVGAILAYFVLRVAGLTRLGSALVAGAAPLFVLVDAPLGDLAPRVPLSANVAGCVIPVLVGAWTLGARRVPPAAAVLLVSLGTASAFLFSRVVPAKGVMLEFVRPTLVVALGAAMLFRARPGLAGAAAFAAGAIGVLLGADAFHLPELVGPQTASRITLGGAGLLDGIFLVAVLSCVLAEAFAMILRFAAAKWDARRATRISLGSPKPAP